MFPFISVVSNTSWLYGGYLKKGHPVGLENEVTNAYLQNTVNWPIPACKSGDSADVDETGLLDLQSQRATDSQSTERYWEHTAVSMTKAWIRAIPLQLSSISLQQRLLWHVP